MLSILQNLFKALLLIKALAPKLHLQRDRDFNLRSTAPLTWHFL